MARVKRRLLRQSYVGAVYTSRDHASQAARYSDSDSTRPSRPRRFSLVHLESTAWLHASTTGIASAAASVGAINYPNDRWNARLDATECRRTSTPASASSPAATIASTFHRHVCAATGQQSTRPAIHVQVHRGHADRSRQRPVLAHLEATLLQVNFQSQRISRSTPSGSTSASTPLCHQPRHHAAARREYSFIRASA